jgi:hypothetical protein
VTRVLSRSGQHERQLGPDHLGATRRFAAEHACAGARRPVERGLGVSALCSVVSRLVMLLARYQAAERHSYEPDSRDARGATGRPPGRFGRTLG